MAHRGESPSGDSDVGKARRSRSILSCDFCRLRKIRCDKEEICSNCVIKGVPCTREDAEAARAHPYCQPRKNTKERSRRKRSTTSPSLSGSSSEISGGSPLPVYDQSPEPPAYASPRDRPAEIVLPSSCMPFDEPMVARLGLNSYEAYMTAFGSSPSISPMPSASSLRKTKRSSWDPLPLPVAPINQVPRAGSFSDLGSYWTALPSSTPMSLEPTIKASPAPAATFFFDPFDIAAERPALPATVNGEEDGAWTPDSDFLLDLLA